MMDAFNSSDDPFTDLLDEFGDIDIVDFGTVKEEKSEPKNISSYKRNGIPIEFTKRTTEYYRVMRTRRTDPIIEFEDIPDNIAFEFKHQWDPYTGERVGLDPYGPLVFHPISLAKHFHTQRLRKLWIDGQDANDGQWGGNYDDGVGAGDDMYIPSRGHFPELYLFRLPIQDLYLTKDHNDQIPIMGPKLTDEEVKDLNAKLQLVKHEYRRYFRCDPPDLVLMKKYYDTAIAKQPSIGLSPSDLKKISKEELQLRYDTANREAVEALKKMRG